MEKKLTLQDVINSVNTISAIFTNHFNVVDTQLSSIEGRLTLLETHFAIFGTHLGGLESETRSLNAKTTRIKITVNNTQKDVTALHEEMRGIHKVLDRFDERTTRLEIHAGFQVNSPGEA